MLLSLPSYSPNLNLIERPWRFTTREAAYEKFRRGFASFRAAIEATPAGIPATYLDALTSSITLTF